MIIKSGFIDLGIVRRDQDVTDARATLLAAEAAEYDSGFEGEVVREMLEKVGGLDDED